MGRYLVLLFVASTSACTARALAPPELRDGSTDLRSPLVDMTLRTDMLPDLADLAFDMAMPPFNPCPAGTEFIYTIDSDTTLSRFSPASNQFFDVGPISCPDPGSSPNSMAIDRSGNGWVNYEDGNLFRLNTTTLQCSATQYAPDQAGLLTFGMSFSENSPGSTEETLFIADTSSGMPPTELATIDLTSFTLSSEITIASDAEPELTGDDQANLWGFFPVDSPPRVARIDKKKGTLDRIFQLPTLAGSPQAWGVAAFQGAFYIFLQRDIDPSTVVYRLDGTTGAVTTVADNTGRKIVGVGVATCAGNGQD